MQLLTEPVSPTLYEAPPAMHRTDFTVRSGDVMLAAKAWGDPARPTVVLVHGYPDNSEVWDALAALLAHDFHVVAYDVRGAGQSSAPKGMAAYRLGKLTDDFIAVIDAVSPNRAVHLVAHDWGSIQGWEFVTEERLHGRITSCSGPCLDHVAYWMRARLLRPTPRSIGKLMGQLVRSWYVLLFHWKRWRLDRDRMRQKATKLYPLRGLQPETVAKAALRAVLRNKPVVAIGIEAHSMRFISRYMPGLSRMIARISMVSR